VVDELEKGRPVICYGDILHLPYFYTNRHFGGHAFVVYAIDEPKDAVWISDRGEYPRLITLSDLAKARSSNTSVFRPKNALLRIQINHEAELTSGDIWRAIYRSYKAMCEPPISNFGLAGIETFGGWLRRAIEELPAVALSELLMSLYVNLELAGTGGCAFRIIYRQFLIEAKRSITCDALDDAINSLDRSIEAWTAFINGLLPPTGPASIELKQHLQAKERIFEKASTEEVHLAARIAERIGELIQPAGHEFAAARAELKNHVQVLNDVVQWESEAFQSLERARKERS